MEQVSKLSNFKKKVLERVKKLNSEGKHLEASALYLKYLSNFEK